MTRSNAQISRLHTELLGRALQVRARSGELLLRVEALFMQYRVRPIVRAVALAYALVVGALPGTIHANETISAMPMARAGEATSAGSMQAIDSVALEALQRAVGVSTASLQAMDRRYLDAREASMRAKLVKDMQAMAANRQTQWESLAQAHPDRALTLATLVPERKAFPETVRPYLEDVVDLEGTLEIAVEDDLVGGRSRMHYTLVIGNARYTLHPIHDVASFGGTEEGWESGARIRVQGTKLGHHIVVRR